MILSLQCDCGAVQGTVDSKHLKGFRAVCLCNDCQIYAQFLNRSDTLDVNGGTDIIPTMPSHLQFTSGSDKLNCMRLYNKGMFRWYAECCKTPMGNAMATQAMPFIGVPARIFKDQNNIENAFGPVTERMQAQFGKGTLPPGAQKKVSMAFMLRVLKFILIAKITGAGKPSPFFNEKGEPLKQPKILSKEERDSVKHLVGTKREDI